MFYKRSRLPKHYLFSNSISRFICILICLTVIFSGLSSIPATAQQHQSDETFMWVGASQLMDREPRMFDNILAFAERHGITPYESGVRQPEDLTRFLKLCKKHGIEQTWIEIGPREQNTGDATAEEFVKHPDRREPTLERFRKLARAYKAVYPDFARITIFDEAPLGAFARTDGGYLSDFQDFKRYGPRAFAYMYKAFKSVMPQAEIGIFMHHPHNASPSTAGDYSYIGEFMQSCDSLNAVPDFIFSDVYRGYFNRGYGVEATNDYIRDVVDYTGKVADQHGVNHYQLGQVHTIKLGYTPSRRQIDTNIDAMLDGKPDGIGWYWPNYASTNYKKSGSDRTPRDEGYDVSFDPFVPNAWGRIGPAGSLYGTSRDRFTYSYLSILESVGMLHPAEKFDLYLYGHDFDHTEHGLYLKSKTDDQWEFIGYFNPQQDRDAYLESARSKYIYSYNDKWHALVFHGLDRKRFIDTVDNEVRLTFKITTPEGSDTSRITGVYAMPYRKTRHYKTEGEITRLIESHPRWMEINSIATHVRPKAAELKDGRVFTGSATSGSGAN